jgi:hypothetical protein
MSDQISPNTLYASFDAMAKGSEKGDSSAAHRAILHRLAVNRRSAPDTAEPQGSANIRRSASV